MAAHPDAELCRKRAQGMLDFLRGKAPDSDSQPGYDAVVLADIENVQSTGPGNCSCELRVKKAQANSYGTLHGGCAGEPRYLDRLRPFQEIAAWQLLFHVPSAVRQDVVLVRPAGGALAQKP